MQRARPRFVGSRRLPSRLGACAGFRFLTHFGPPLRIDLLKWSGVAFGDLGVKFGASGIEATSLINAVAQGSLNACKAAIRDLTFKPAALRAGNRECVNTLAGHEQV